MIDLGGDGMTDQNGQHHPIPEFLYQLTKMLTDDNSEIIEWQDGRIKVHHPERLEGEVLARYFRHSKFASFQRQLNYFGFRKIAGKGKMSPCSYVNEAATDDIRSLLLIKRKTNGSAARKAALQQRAALTNAAMNPALLSMNLATLAAAGQAGVAGLNGLPNAMSLLSENALRAGLGQLQMQQNNNNVLGPAQLNLLVLQQQLAQQQQQFAQQQQQLVNSFSQEKLGMLAQDQQQNNNNNNNLMQGTSSNLQGGMQQGNMNQGMNQGGMNQGELNGLNQAGLNSLNQGNLGQLNQGGLNQGGVSQNGLNQGNQGVLNQGMNQFKDLQSNQQQSQFSKNPSLEQLHAQLAASLAASQQQQLQQQQQQQQQGQQQQSQQQQQLNLQQQAQQQLQRHLQQQQQNNPFTFGSLSSSGMNLAASNPATAALKLASFNSPTPGMDNPASAALMAAQKNSMPATAAMDAASGAATNSLFESAVNLKSLLQEHQESANRAQNSAAANAASQALLNRLPSSSAIFPDSMSTASFGHLLGSSNRLNSLVSLNSFVGSRETSLADFAALSAQLAASNSNQQRQAQVAQAAQASAELARLRNP